MSDIQTPVLKELRSLRLKVFEGKTNPEKDKHQLVPIIPGYPCGPLVATTGVEENKYVTATSEKDVIQRCKDELQKNTNKGVPLISFDDLIDTMTEEKLNHGVGIHLLHIYPFSLVSKITCDTLKRKCFQSTTEMIKELLSELAKKDSMYIGVPRLTNYADILEEQRDNCYTDPLKDNTSLWGQFFYLPNLDQPYKYQCQLGLYLISRQRFVMKLNIMKGKFINFETYTLPQTSPVETNILFRWKKAAEVFNYQYRIERVRPLTFARVPCDFVKVINDVIQTKNGRCSLFFLLQSVAKHYRTNPVNMLILLRHVSEKKDSRWIYFQTKDTEQNTTTLQEGSLEYDVEENKGKYFWSSLSEMEQTHNMNFDFIRTDERVSMFASGCSIGFCYECGLRIKENLNQVCPFRFQNRAEKIKHIKECHTLDHGQLCQLKETFGSLLPIVDMESDQEFLEKHGILDVFSVNEISRIPHIGKLIDEFVNLRCRNRELVSRLSLLWEEFSACQEAMCKKLQKIVDEDFSQELSKKQAMQLHIIEMQNKSMYCFNVLKTYEKLLLPDEVFSKHLNILCAAMEKQSNILSKFNEIKDSFNETNIAAGQMCKALTGRWHSQLHKAGSNVASIASHSYLQQSDTKRTPSNYASLALGMITSLEENRLKSAQHTSQIYKKYLDRFPQADEKLFGKRKRDDDRDKPNDDGHMHKVFKSCVKDMDGKLPTGEMFCKTMLAMKEKEQQQNNQKPEKKPFLDLVLPVDITVDLRDYKPLLFYIIYTLDGCHTNMDYVIKLSNTFVNILTNLFCLNDDGRQILEAAIQSLIVQVLQATKGRSDKDTKQLLWRIFLSAIEFINCNSNGIMNRYFRVRLSLGHGKRKLLPIEFQHLNYVAGEENGVKDEMIKLFVRGTHSLLDVSTHKSCIVPMKNSSSSVYREQLQQQKPLLQQLTTMYNQELKHLSQSHMNKCHLVSIDTIEQFSRTKFLHSLQTKKFQDKYKPNYLMSNKEEVNKHTKSVYETKHQSCPICLEPFSNRPLEGFNCSYRALERKFRKDFHLHSSVNIEKDAKLNQKYMMYVSKEIDKAKGRKDDPNDCLGVHLFHLSCIRRAIQFAALDPNKKTIDCPICKTEIYNEQEKHTVLQNIVEIACELTLAVDKEEISHMQSDNMIDLKGHFTKSKCSLFQMNASDDGDNKLPFGQESNMNNFQTLRKDKGDMGCLKSVKDYIHIVVNENETFEKLLDDKTSKHMYDTDVEIKARYAVQESISHAHMPI